MPPKLRQASQRSTEFGWTLSQRRALLALLAVLLLFLTLRYALNRQYISDPQPTQGVRAGELDSKIDPNDADWEALSAIPTLGEKRAKEIVAYRDRLRSAGKTSIVFAQPTDLLHIRGIGAATVENIKPYLSFPGQSSTGR